MVLELLKCLEVLLIEPSIWNTALEMCKMCLEKEVREKSDTKITYFSYRIQNNVIYNVIVCYVGLRM